MTPNARPSVFSSGLLFWINAALAATTATIFAVALVAYLSVERLRGQVESWSAVDEIRFRNFDLTLLLEKARDAPTPAAHARIQGAFTFLANTIRTSDLEDHLSQTLSGSILTAQRAYVEHQRQRNIAREQLREPRASLDRFENLLALEINRLQALRAESQSRSKSLEDSQRASISRTTELADIIAASKVILAQMQALPPVPYGADPEQMTIRLIGLPDGCGTPQQAESAICIPSPNRVIDMVAALNATPPGPDRDMAEKQALRAAMAYSRTLQGFFEAESVVLAANIDALEQERGITQALTTLLLDLSRINQIIQKTEEGVRSLPMVSEAEIEQLTRQMSAHLRQISQGGQGLSRSTLSDPALVSELSSGAAALGSAWTQAVDAQRASLSSAQAMSDALTSMQAEIDNQTTNRKESALKWISGFTSATVVGIILFLVFVTAVGLIALRKLARPMRDVVRLIISMAQGGQNVPIEPPHHAGAMREIYSALEVLRRAQAGRIEAEQRVSRTSHKLKKAHERITRLADTAPAGLFEMCLLPDGKLQFDYASKKFDVLYHCNATENPGETVLEHIEADDRQSFLNAMQTSAKTMTPLRHRHRILHPERGTIWVLNESIPRIGMDGAVHWVGAASDITDEVTQETLLSEARDRAEAANTEKSKFLANMSHEIRTPMNGIIGMCDLIADTEMTAQQRLGLETIDRSAQQLLSIINDVLDLSKLEANKQQLSNSALHLEALVYDVCKVISDSAWRKNLELCIDFDAGIGRRIGDSVKLRHVLLNLLSNAVKFTDEGFVILSVTTDGRDKVRFSVQDTGIGIDHPDQERILQPFEQVDNAHTRTLDGTGLGLSICAGMVKLMGGEIEIRSELGHGASFSFEIELPPMSNVQPFAAQNVLAGEHVLVIEAGGPSRNILEKQLEAIGAQVETAANPKDALSKAQKAPEAVVGYTAIILDCAYADCDLEPLFRHTVSTSGMPRVILHAPLEYAIANNQSNKRAYEAWLKKPARTAEIVSAIRADNCISSAPSASLARAQSPTAHAHSPMAYGQSSVMVVEDNKTNQFIAQKMLEKLGFAPRLCTDGQEAVNAYIAQPAEIIFMDVAMPVMNGLDATREIRKHERNNGLPPALVVALTAHVSDEDKAACKAAGMDRFMTKPVTIEQLKYALPQAQEAALEGYG